MIKEYSKSKNEIYKYLMSKKHIVLATSANERVTARTISYIIIDDKILFQTDSNFLKVKQIELNNKVALCIDNIQIEGIAKITGNPFDECNRDFLEKYKQIHKSSYDKYSNIKNEIVIEISPILITEWKYENNIGVRYITNLQNQTVERVTMDV